MPFSSLILDQTRTVSPALKSSALRAEISTGLNFILFTIIPLKNLIIKLKSPARKVDFLTEQVVGLL